MNEELKPCPFCGGEPDLVGVINSDITNIICSCGASFTHERKASRYTLEETVEAWNYRPAEERLQKRIEELEKALREIFTYPVHPNDDMMRYVIAASEMYELLDFWFQNTEGMLDGAALDFYKKVEDVLKNARGEE